MTPPVDRHLPLAGAYNIRDLGGYRTKSGRPTAWRRLLRADSPHNLSAADIDRLLEHGLRRVIDLRSESELRQATNPFAAHPGVSYANIPLFDHLAPDTMRDAALTRSDDPVFDFYAATLATRGPAIAAALSGIAEADGGAVLFHCTAGKDRTGLIAALMLGLAGVGDDDIVTDYARTEALIAELVMHFLELARQNGTDLDNYRRMLASNPDTMRRVLDHLRSEYGETDDYLSGIGLDTATRAQLRGRLLPP